MKLFESTATSFVDNGLGVLHPLKCIEHKKKSLNGWYVECEFPISYKEKIVQGAILYVETKEKGGQPFRCNNPKYKDRKIKVTANHVVFDSEKYILEDVRPTDLAPVSFLKWINERTDISSPFSVSSDVTGSGTKYFIRKTLLDGFKETEAMFGGSYDVDGFNVNLKTEVGTDDGFSVAYGKNLQSISIIEDWSAVCTKLLPVGPDGLKLPEVYLYTETQYDIPYSKVVEFNIPTSYENENGETIDYTTEELIVMLREEAQKYISDSYIPKINYVVKSDVPQSLRIGDVVHVKHPILTIDTEVQAYEYDTISKCVLALEFGNYERDVKKLFDSIKTSVEEAKTNASIALVVARKQTDLINSLNKNGIVYIDENEILVLDKLPKEDAQNVWRFGLGGIGFSSNGYEGPFEYALTQDGYFNVDFIKADSITGDMVKAESITADKLSVEITETITNAQNKAEKTNAQVERLNTKVTEMTTSLRVIENEINATIMEIENDIMKKLTEFTLELEKIMLDVASINSKTEMTKGEDLQTWESNEVPTLMNYPTFTDFFIWKNCIDTLYCNDNLICGTNDYATHENEVLYNAMTKKYYIFLKENEEYYWKELSDEEYKEISNYYSSISVLKEKIRMENVFNENVGYAELSHDGFRASQMYCC